MAATPVIEDFSVVVVQKDTVESAVETILFQGWLQWTTKKKNSFKKKFVVLRKKPALELSLYEKQYDIKSRKPSPTEVVLVKTIEHIKPLAKAKKPNAIDFAYTANGKLEEWIFSCASEEERLQWLHHIRSVLTLAQDDDNLQGADQFDLHADLPVSSGTPTVDPLMVGLNGGVF